MAITLRPMTSADYADVYRLWLSCEGMGLNSVDDSEAGIARFLARNPETCLVAVEAAAIVGVILVGCDGRRAYVYHTAVSPQHRHQGIAGALLNAAMEALARQGIVKAALVVFTRNESGNAFWEKQGFTRREDIIYRNKALAEVVRIDT